MTTNSRSRDGGGLTLTNTTRTCAIFLSLIVLAVINAAAAGCGPGVFEVRSHLFGKNISTQGEAVDGPLSYTFRPYRGGGTGRDLFNFLYFEGDTLCFSMEFSEPLINARAEGWFVNPETGKRCRVERMEKSGNILWGFSLVGSLMEKFYADMSMKPLPHDAFCCRDIPFELHIAVRKPGRKLITEKYSSSFRLQYRRSSQ